MSKEKTCTFREYLLDVVKIFIESYKAIFIDVKEKLKEVPEVFAFIGKAIWNNKKQSVMLLAIQFPFIFIYVSFRYLKFNALYMMAGISSALMAGIVLQLYYYYLLNNKKRLLEEK